MSNNEIQPVPAETDAVNADSAIDAVEVVATGTAGNTVVSGTEESEATDAGNPASAAAGGEAEDEPSPTRPSGSSSVVARVRKSLARGGATPALGKRGRIALRAAAVIALVASAGAGIVFYQRDSHDKDLLAAQEQARAAACRYAPVLATYDAKNLDAYFSAVMDGATGDWRKQFDSTSKDLREVLSQGQVVSKATDVQCAVRNADRNSAEAIVVIGQTITSLGTQGKPAPGQLSMVMRLERSGDRWLVNKVNSPLAQQPQQ
ncbi:hypothetical protein [Nocardia terrae]|uniref:hypothetical protein n=1 Tax=Nocardia terrae TaxID=2675851 RepID=UPI0018DFB726|nr:hypothetical protein [Nocardia terrae]